MSNLAHYVVETLLEGISLPAPIAIEHIPVKDYESDPYWISPDARIYDAGESHSGFAYKYVHPEIPDFEAVRAQTIADGWIRIRTHPTERTLEVSYAKDKVKPAQMAVMQRIASAQNLKIERS